MAVLLQLSLCVVTVIQLTSSQSTYDVIQQENDVNSCGSTERMFSQLMTVASQMQTTISQLQRDVAELKAFNQQKDVKGICLKRDRNSTAIHSFILLVCMH